MVLGIFKTNFMVLAQTLILRIGQLLFALGLPLEIQQEQPQMMPEGHPLDIKKIRGIKVSFRRFRRLGVNKIPCHGGNFYFLFVKVLILP